MNLVALKKSGNVTQFSKLTKLELYSITDMTTNSLKAFAEK